ncbi:CDP-alcohol phosphatidyltransferase [Methanocella sp. CWC-04]|uniref:CDP-alcohol phosphatidyltransferase n=1 Tax=Methanooceanicella nereidis TaxID=2052831 RepID=A0AAP2RAG5_9EURY|nr:CDP-alcohol phosphatidyltransferase family protein [Methanocella sp. CWC-04]MCD1293723.1 CDP-alcohol phosphatidyltransferase [Methanocella sp. CWC-04]
MNITKYRDSLIHFIYPVSRFFARLGITPNQITLLSLLFGMGSAVLYAYQYAYFAAGMLLLSALFDFIDGGVARINNKKSRFGAAIDWIADKYVDGLVLIGIAFSGLVNPGIAAIAIFGSMMNTFIKPVVYAEIGFDKKEDGKIKDPLESVGIFGRPETVITLIVLSCLNHVDWAVIVIALMTNFSALQRVFYLYRNRTRY